MGSEQRVPRSRVLALRRLIGLHCRRRVANLDRIGRCHSAQRHSSTLRALGQQSCSRVRTRVLERPVLVVQVLMVVIVLLVDDKASAGWRRRLMMLMLLLVMVVSGVGLIVDALIVEQVLLHRLL